MSGTFIDTSVYIGAFDGEKLVGFIKLTIDDTGTQAGMMHIISMIQHRDKAPTNALVAHAVRSCADRGIQYLVYSQFAYGKKQTSSLSDFKERNAFTRVDLPRYYVPLSTWGSMALNMRLHQKLTDRLPAKFAEKLRDMRSKWYQKRFDLKPDSLLGELLVPGIVGIVTNRPKAEAERELSQMLETLRHESFYVADTWSDPVLGVYVGWVAREGFFAAEMPLRNEHRDVTLIFSGEEFPEQGKIQSLRAAGHAVSQDGPAYLVHRYEDEPDFPKQLNGRFHGLVADSRKWVGNVVQRPLWFAANLLLPSTRRFLLRS